MVLDEPKEPGVDIGGFVDLCSISRFDKIEKVLAGFGASCGVERENKAATGEGNGLCEGDGAALSEDWVGVIDLLEVLKVFGSKFFQGLARVSVERAVCCKECLSSAIPIIFICETEGTGEVCSLG